MTNNRDIRDRSGRLIAHERTSSNGEVTVTDRTGRLLGTASKTGTRDRSGRLLSNDNAPGLLYPRE